MTIAGIGTAAATGLRLPWLQHEQQQHHLAQQSRLDKLRPEGAAGLRPAGRVRGEAMACSASTAMSTPSLPPCTTTQRRRPGMDRARSRRC
ncbi:Os05g0197701 [Oryza sativa Japonica Group]|uniref:Os05g0197701 protein n=1 Tax=Oryza sativa subsp. japonica TaxID=39947 RepID=A0A0P0WJ85_ORYSJ|nr:Os05g0197701 [Oryza sativa Japonica Group]